MAAPDRLDVAAYVGLPYRSRGRDRGGVDCWGLVRMALAELLGLELPAYDEYASAEDLAEAAAQIRRALPDWLEIAAGEELPGDVIVLERSGLPTHVGLVVEPGRMLNVREGANAVVELYGRGARLWGRRQRRFYRYPQGVPVSSIDRPGPSIDRPPLPAGQLAVVAHQSPFRSGHRSLTLPAGGTIAELLTAAVEHEPWRAHAHVQLGDRPIPRRLWPLVRPKAGQRLVVTLVPGDGNALRLVGTIAVIALAASAGPWGAGALGVTAAAGFSAASVAATGAVITGAVSMTGMLALNALVPPAQPQLDRAASAGSPTYGFAGASNRLRPQQPVPVVLGRHKITPDLGAPNWTEIVGDDVYLRMLLVWGQGPVLIEDIRIGDTPIGEFDGVKLQHRYGYDDDTPLTLFPALVLEEGFSILLQASDGRQVRTTAEDVVEITGDLTFGEGLGRVSSNGKNRDPYTVAVRIETRPAGGGAWTVQETLTVTEERIGRPFRRGWSIEVTKGRYDVALTRMTADTPPGDAERIFDLVSWTALRSVQDGNPVRMQGVAMTAVRIKGSNQLNGVLDNVTGIVTSRARRAWNGAAWVANEPSRNPADLYRYVLEHRGNAKRIASQSRIDLAELQDWHAECTARGWTCDLVVDWKSTVTEVLDLVAACGRAARTFVDGRHSVVRDRPQSEPVQHFTPRNSSGLRIRRAYVKLPHALRIRFVNAARDFVQDSVTVCDDGYTEATATRFEDDEAPLGMTDRKTVWAWGRTRIAEARLRPDSISLEVGWEHIVARRGELVLVSHDLPLWGIGGGRIKARTLNGGATHVLAVTLDETMVLDGADHVLRATLGDGSLPIWPLADVSGEVDTFTFASAVPIATAPAVGNLVTIGKEGRETRSLLVRSVAWKSNYGATLGLVDAAPAVHLADKAPIPEFDAGVTMPADSLRPIIVSVRSSEDALPTSPDGSWRPGIVVTLALTTDRPTARMRAVDLTWRLKGAETWQRLVGEPDARELVIWDVTVGKVYEIRVRYLLEAVTKGGKAGASVWAGPVEHEVEAPSIAPPDVERVWSDGDVIRWTDGALAPDHAGWLVRTSLNTNTTWRFAAKAHGGVLTEPRIRLDQLPDGAFYLHVKAVRRSGLESAAAARLNVVNRGADGKRHRYAPFDYAAARFPGLIKGGAVQAVTDGWQLAANSSALFLSNPGGLFLDSPGERFLRGAFEPLAYECDYAVPPDARADDRIVIEHVIEGLESIEARWVADVVQQADPEAPFLSHLDPEAPFLSDRAAPFLAQILPDPAKPYGIWRGFVQPVPGDMLRIRVTCYGGAAQGLISALSIRLDALDRTDSCTLDVQPAGSRASPALWAKGEEFRRLLSVRTTIVDDGLPDSPAAAAVRTVWLQPDPLNDARNGPLVQAQTATRAGVSARLAVEVGGF